MSGPQMAPAFDHALGIIEDVPDLDVGLHFTLVGAPGLPEDYVAFLQAKLLGDFPSSGIREMLRRQLDTLIEKNVHVSHIDSHQHLHALPSIMRVVAEVANEYGIKAVRLPAEQGDFAGVDKKRVILTKIVALLCQRSRVELDRANIKYPDHFAGMAISGALIPSSMVKILRGLGEGTTEVVCHPGADNLTLGSKYSWGYNWQGELSAVTDRSVFDAIDELAIERVAFASLSSSR